MRHAVVPPLCSLLVLAGCALENKVSSEQDDPVPFDTGTPWDPPAVDTSDTDVGDDSGGTVTQGEGCVDNVFPGHAITGLEDCDAPSSGSEPSWNLVTKFGDMTLGMTLSTPAFGNVNDDNGNGVIDAGDTPDVVVAPYSGGVHAYDGITGVELWHNATGSIEQTTPVIADLDGDGLPEVVIGGLYGSYAYHGSDGTEYWASNPSLSTKPYCGAVAVADLDGNGEPEVLLGKLILSGQDGTEIGKGTHGEGSSYTGEAPSSIAADIDLDGQQEVIVGNAAYDIDGNDIWYNGALDGYPAVGNFDSDPEAEIVVAAGSGNTYLYDTDGTEIWAVRYTSGGSYQGPPVIADLDGDGEPEIAVPTNSGIVAYEGDGTQMWSYSNGTGSMFDGASAYDLDGDGDWEVLDNGVSSLRILDGITGELLSEFMHTTNQYACGQAPVVADIDGDGSVEIGYGVYSTPGGFGVLQDADEGFTPGLVYWNQHAFSITNINEDMTVPTYPDPSWEDHNSFRAGPSIGALFPNKNLTVQLEDVCISECAEGRLTVWWSLGNNGSEDIEDDVVVEIWGVSDGGDVLLATTTYSGTKPANWMSNSQQTEITGVPVPLYDVSVSIDGGNLEDGGEVGECDETDNVATLGSPLCL